MPVETSLMAALGATRYVVESPFGSLPPGKVTDIAVAPDGAVFVLTRCDSRIDPPQDCVHMLTEAGGHVRSWGKGRITDAHKIAVDPQGRIWVVDRDCHEIVAFDRQGQELTTLGRRNAPLDPFNHPSDIAFFADGSIAVSDGYAAARVHLFTAAGAPAGGFGALGRGSGQFIVPHGIATLSDGRVAVADRENNRVQLFSRNGDVLGVFGFFVRPQDVWVDEDDTILVTDSIPTLTRISPEGEVLGRCRATLNGPHGMCGSATGAIYLAENNPSRVTRILPVAPEVQALAV